MKKSVFYVGMALLTLLTLPMPLLADGGHGDEEVAVTAVTSSVNPTALLIIASVVLTILSVAVIVGINKSALSKWQISIAGLTALSGFIHLGIGLQGDILLLINGIGYLVLCLAISYPFAFLKQKQTLLLWLLLGYTGITFIGYFLSHSPSQFSNLGLITKGIELGLAACLAIRLWELGQTKEDQTAFG